MRAVVIGAGLIAKQHLAALQKCRNVEVVGVCDLSPAKAEAASERFGVSGWFTDHREMLAQTRPDVAHVTTPARTHCRIGTDCLRSGANVLIEKPIATDETELEQILDEAEEAGRWVIEDYNYLFNDDVQAMRRLAASGRMGELRRVEVRLHLGVFGPGSPYLDADAPHPATGEPLGAVSDFITHMAYLAHAFAGRGVADGVSCRRRNDSSPSIDSLVATIDGEACVATLAFDAYAQPDEFRLRVHGSRLVVDANLFEKGLTVTECGESPNPLSPIRGSLSRGAQEVRNAGRSLSRKLSGGPGAYEGLWRLIAGAYESLEAGKAPPISPSHIRSVNRLVAELSQAGGEVCVSS
ncbi:putative oxidoreductase YcjS [Pseudobythopirellula maris]|uniref:Putative oxidoreductase YcjS n=1 Tax=Pseudobythopirellula maris TaxID=2527991 RepID=A0A5C5ZJJ0_9BACT|nr:Gfo/Idh/MocA family oxidoreductase [Pseudobythopirellula maris]TWT87529.1 putative oxidoreductase YcjS [Pseudobythopirellula maris]